MTGTIPHQTIKTVVASYNIHSGVGVDGRRDLRRCVEVIRYMDADVIGLQEVGGYTSRKSRIDQLQYLANTLDYFPIAGPTLFRQDHPYGNAILTRHPIGSQRSIDLSVEGREPRGALEVLLNVSGEKLRVIVTHLGLKHKERQEQRKTLAALMQKSEPPTVLLGDLNQWWPLFGKVDRRWLHAVKVLRTYPAWFPIFPLDRIFVMPPEMLKEVTVIKTPLARRASDHLPLRGVLKIRRRVATGERFSVVQPVNAQTSSTT